MPVVVTKPATKIEEKEDHVLNSMRYPDIPDQVSIAGFQRRSIVHPVMVEPSVGAISVGIDGGVVSPRQLKLTGLCRPVFPTAISTKSIRSVLIDHISQQLRSAFIHQELVIEVIPVSSSGSQVRRLSLI